MAARHVVFAERKLTTYVYAVDKYGSGLRKAGRYKVGIRVDSCLPVSQFETMDDDRDAALVFYEMQPLLFDGTQRTVSLAGWLYDMESIFGICHIEAHLQVLLATRCLAVEARVWWMTEGEPAMPEGTWADFRILITARYGPPPDEDSNMPARDPEIYNDMYLSHFLSYVADWSAYPNESMGHYCRRFQEAMAFVPEPIAGMTLEGMIEIIMEAEIIVQGIQAAAPEEDQVVPVHDADIEEAGAENDVMDPADIPEDHPKTLPLSSSRVTMRKKTSTILRSRRKIPRRFYLTMLIGTRTPTFLPTDR
ncbi:hypothetical protein TIFTF001_040597 [Ficus carica]|uniref:Uncharacterized protein n=1 Tax=Ficus carica TaxID=3494 RepID=A0AA87YY67_FICCA|nr:hypothetical protein TIFTF001_040597 [Ficus carica]